MRQNTGRVPEGGLARHRVEESAAPCLPPPKADVPSRATGRCQNCSQASEVAREVMVCSTLSGASYYPGQPGSWCTHHDLGHVMHRVMWSKGGERVQSGSCIVFLRHMIREVRKTSNGSSAVN